MPSQNKLIKILVALSFILAICFTIFSFLHEINNQKLPILGEVKSFSLTDSNYKPFLSQSLKGKVWIVNFFFTTCSDVCPMMTKHMAALNKTFELVPEVMLLSITVNPENDTPEVLEKYKNIQKARKNWMFLTGTREDITNVAVSSFKLGDIKEPIFHSTRFALVDKMGMLRGYYDGTKQEEINKLFKDAAKLLKEKVYGFN